MRDSVPIERRAAIPQADLDACTRHHTRRAPTGKYRIARAHAAHELSNPGRRVTPQVADGSVLGREHTLAPQRTERHATAEKDVEEGSRHHGGCLVRFT